MRNITFNEDYLKTSRTPTVAFVAGVHGNESNSVKALSLVNFASLPFCSRVFGYVNLPGLEQNTREYPEQPNTRDLNRCFANTQLEKNDLVAQLSKYLNDRRQIIIDVHSSENCRNLVLLGCTYKETNIRKVLKDAGIPTIQWSSTSGTIREHFNQDPSVIAVTIELGGMGQVSDDKMVAEVSFIEQVAKILYDNYDTIINNPDKKVYHNDAISDTVTINSKHQGILHYLPDYKSIFDVTYRKGESIAFITDGYRQDAVEYIEAPYDNCIVMEATTMAYVGANNFIVTVMPKPELSEPNKPKRPIEEKYDVFVEGKAPSYTDKVEITVSTEKSKLKVSDDKVSIYEDKPEDTKEDNTCNSGLYASPEECKYATECEIDCANFIADNFDCEVKHGIVAKTYEEFEKLKNNPAYHKGVIAEHDDSATINYKFGDVRTKKFYIDVKSSAKYSLASISGAFDEETFNEKVKLYNSENEAMRRLMRDHIYNTFIQYYVSYGTKGKLLIKKSTLLDLLDKDGLNGQKGYVLKSTVQRRPGKVECYLPLGQWYEKFSEFRNNCFPLESIIDLEK